MFDLSATHTRTHTFFKTEEISPRRLRDLFKVIELVSDETDV